jgi:hypothetical protein
MRTIQDLSARIRAEYLEMPGLRMKADQIQTLCDIEHTICALVLDSLVTSGFLYVTTDGYYARASDGVSGSPAKHRPRSTTSSAPSRMRAIRQD